MSYTKSNAVHVSVCDHEYALVYMPHAAARRRAWLCFRRWREISHTYSIDRAFRNLRSSAKTLGVRWRSRSVENKCTSQGRKVECHGAIGRASEGCDADRRRGHIRISIFGNSPRSDEMWSWDNPDRDQRGHSPVSSGWHFNGIIKPKAFKKSPKNGPRNRPKVQNVY